MGLEMVEIVCSTEDAFGISISDEDASRMRTVGDLYTHILDKIGRQESVVCATGVVFYRLRRALVEICGLDRKSVHPDTPLARALPRIGRRTSWRLLTQHTGFRLPELGWPLWLHLLLLALYASAFFILLRVLFLWFGSLNPPDWAMVPAVIVMSVMFFSLTVLFFSIDSHLVSRTGWTIPRSCTTVGCMAKRVLVLNYREQADQIGVYNPDEVWQVLQDIIVDATPAEPGDVTPEARFVEDLGVG